VVERVVIGSPAWQAGVHTGDVIIATDAIPVAGLAMPRIKQLLRGPVNSEGGEQLAGGDYQQSGE
jgi:C-terminal processing protease CtpA/Prc